MSARNLQTCAVSVSARVVFRRPTGVQVVRLLGATLSSLVVSLSFAPDVNCAPGMSLQEGQIELPWARTKVSLGLWWTLRAPREQFYRRLLLDTSGRGCNQVVESGAQQSGKLVQLDLWGPSSCGPSLVTRPPPALIPHCPGPPHLLLRLLLQTSPPVPGSPHPPRRCSSTPTQNWAAASLPFLRLGICIEDSRTPP